MKTNQSFNVIKIDNFYSYHQNQFTILSYIYIGTHEEFVEIC